MPCAARSRRSALKVALLVGLACKAWWLETAAAQAQAQAQQQRGASSGSDDGGCVAGCAACADRSTCAECDVGRWRTSAGSRCERCVPNCRRCVGASKCGECEDGYWPAAGGSRCDRCGDHCRTCTNPSGTCLSCEDGFDTIPGLASCYPGPLDDGCVAMPHCSKCTETLCLQCDDGHFHDGWSCRSCPNNCASCPNGVCERCKARHQMALLAGRLQCVHESTVCTYMAHCRTCDGDACVECDRGYALKKVIGGRLTCRATPGPTVSDNGKYAFLPMLFFFFVLPAMVLFGGWWIRSRRGGGRQRTDRQQQHSRVIFRVATVHGRRLIEFSPEFQRPQQQPPGGDAADGGAPNDCDDDGVRLVCPATADSVLVVDPQGNIEVGVVDK